MARLQMSLPGCMACLQHGHEDNKVFKGLHVCKRVLWQWCQISRPSHGCIEHKPQRLVLAMGSNMRSVYLAGLHLGNEVHRTVVIYPAR